MYNKDGIEISQKELESCLRTFKQKMFQKYSLKTSFPNKLLRDDVINLLGIFCTVIFYPLDRETNNGFHVTDLPFLKGYTRHFVFINTAQTMDKQNFTAAHELGHIWKADEYVIDILKLENSEENKEMIINRFAAILLMPEESFLSYFFEEYKKINGDSEKINISDFIKLSVNLMNHFFTPFKSVVNRFFELGLLSKNDFDLILSQQLEDIIKKSVHDCIHECGYTKLSQIHRKKWIEGLPELLNKAEKNDLITKEKLDYLRDLFELKPLTNDTTINKEISLSTQKEVENIED